MSNQTRGRARATVAMLRAPRARSRHDGGMRCGLQASSGGNGERPSTVRAAATDQFEHGCDRKRSERRPRNIVDLAENFMQGAPLIRSLLGGGISVAGAQAFEQLDHIEQGRTSRIAAELISAPCTTHRTHEAGAAQSVHDLRQMMIGYAVFPADLGHR